MEFKDLVITPLVTLLLLLISFLFSRSISNSIEKRYFQIGLLLKIIGALSLGLIYQFYYSGGDTFSYFQQSKLITEAFYKDFSLGMNLLFSNGELTSENFSVASKMKWFGDAPEYFIIRLSAFFGILTYSTYSSIALLFAVLSFTGNWVMYKVTNEYFPDFRRLSGFAIFCIPSVVLWGSGLLKDSIVMGAMGWLIYATSNLIIKRSKLALNIGIALISLYIIYTIKIYVLLAFFPPLIYWCVKQSTFRIKNQSLRRLAAPTLITLVLILSFPALKYVASH